MTYPNVLVLDYMKATGQGSPELQMQAESYINAGYQRLLTFEVAGGGFSLFGKSPARPFLTAYGLMELHDMSQVFPVDPAVIERTAQWLLGQQGADGTWNDSGHSEHWRMDDQVPTTAYIAWALTEAGYGDTPQVQRALGYLREFALQQDAGYSLALVANALAAAAPDDAFTQQVIGELVARAKEDDGAVYWEAGTKSFMGGSGKAGSIETTALAAHALLTVKAHPDVADRALTHLVRAKDSFGTWQTTQATILSLKALLLAATEGPADAGGEGSVRVVLNGEEAKRVDITAENSDVVHLVVLSDAVRHGDNDLRLEVEAGGSGKLNLMYQATAIYYLPWEQVPRVEMGGEAISIEVAYDRTDIAVDDTVSVDVWVGLNTPGTARMVILDLGIPPGFEVLTEDLNALIARSAEQETQVERYELTGRQIILYLNNLSSEAPLRLSYRLRAKFPLRAKTASYRVYDYYNPDVAASQAPTEVEVH